MHSTSDAAKTNTKFRLVVYLLSFFGIAFLISLLGFLLRFTSLISMVHLGELGYTFVHALIFYALGIFLAPFVMRTNSYLRNLINLEDFLSKKQQRIGYVFTLSIFSFICLIQLSTANYSNSNAYSFFYTVPPITAVISIIAALLVEKSLPPAPAASWVQSVMFTGDNGPQCSQTMHGSASWVTDRRKNDLTCLFEDKQPAFEGLWLGGGFFENMPGNLVTVAPPGTGKGAALIIPNLLWIRNYKHSFVVFDPKGTNACITARFRHEQGHKVIIIDPMGLQQMNKATHQIPASCFNPLDHIKDDIFNGTSQIADLMLPDNPRSPDKYWNTDGRNLIQLILMHIMTCKTFDGYRNLTTLHQVMISGRIKFVLEEAETNPALDGLIADSASGFLMMMKSAEKTFFSVLSIASASIKWLSNPAIQKTLQKSDFSPNDLAEGDITLYMCQPIANKEGFATFSRLVTGFCLRANSMPSNRKKAWVYYLLDEFPTMGVFPEVIATLAYSREYQMRLWLFAQSLSQLDSMYKPETRHEILGSTTVFQAFRVTDQITQEYVSKRVGNQTVSYQTQNRSTTSGTSTSTSPNGGVSSNRGESTSYNEAFQGRPLITPEELERDPNIITLTEWGPMRLVRWQYWQSSKEPLHTFYYDIFNDGRADPNPNMRNDNIKSDTDSLITNDPFIKAIKDNEPNQNNSLSHDRSQGLIERANAHKLAEKSKNRLNGHGRSKSFKNR